MRQSTPMITDFPVVSRLLRVRFLAVLICVLFAVPHNHAAQAVTDNCGNEVGNGDTLSAGPDGPMGSDFDQVFRSLTIDPADANVVFVGTERNGVMRTTDGGRTWSWLRNGLRRLGDQYAEVWDISIHPHGYMSGVVAATLDSPGPVQGDYPSAIGGAYKSTDGGESWVRSNCGLVSSRAVSIRHDPLHPENMLLGIEGGTPSFGQLQGQYFDGGLFLSRDAGASWQPMTLPANGGLNGYWHMRSFGATTTSFLTFGFNYDNTADNVGFMKSSDGGLSWSALNTTLNDKLVTSFDVSGDGMRILANVRDSFSVSKSDDGGMSFADFNVNANGPVRMSPADRDIVLFAGSGRLYRSSDGLTTIDNNGGPILDLAGTINDIEFSPSDPAIVYVAATGYSIWKSTDAGRSFTRIINLREDVMNKPVSLSLNRAAYRTGDRLVLRADARPGATGSVKDVYLYVQLPDQTRLYVAPGDEFSTSPVALVSNWAPSLVSGIVFQYVFSGPEPAGEYSWSAGFASPGTMDFSDTLVTVPFTYAP